MQQFFLKRVCFIFLCSSALLITEIGFAQSTIERTGLAQLRAEYGDSLPDGSNAVLSLGEASNGGSSAYVPNTTTGGLASKTVTDQGEPLPDEAATVSGHATGSANNFFGPNSSAPGADNVNAYSAGHWLDGGAINSSASDDPLTQPGQVSNHSYVVRGGEDFGASQAEDLLIRLDYFADRNEHLAVVGSSNGLSTNLPLGLGVAYNVIAVGRTDGNHASGATTFYGEGRTKVDIVAPAGSTSRATPLVASAGALLFDAANGNSDALQSETLKATLLAGATKEEFSDWDRTTTRPIDERYGAGEVNVYNSFKIQEGGQFEGTATLGGPAVGELGWDYSDSFESIGATQERFYRFEIGADQYDNELSIALTWNIDVTDNNASAQVFAPTTDLADLNLELFDSSGNLIDASVSTVDNVEHIFGQDLAPGVYDLRLSGDRDSDFAIAWRFNGSAFAGDFDFDQVVGADDIDFYSGNLGQAAEGSLAILDLDDDNVITADDLELHITTLAQTSNGQTGTSVGDFNLDGQVNVFEDGFILLNSLDGTGPFGFRDGDLNADQIVDVFNDGFGFLDAIQAASGAGAAAASTQSVPEPSGLAILLTLSAARALVRRRRSC